MSQLHCPKCGKSQSAENNECIQCGVLFKKIQAQQNHKPQPYATLTNKPSQPVSPDPVPVKEEPAQSTFLPPVGLKSSGEITILNILAYAYLILGTGSGLTLAVTHQNEYGLYLGWSLLVSSIIISMLFFVICTTAKKILSMDANIALMVELIQLRRSKE